MVRTQIYLSEEVHSRLKSLAKHTSRSRSELIRKAIDEYLSRESPNARLERLRKCRGMWKDRERSEFKEIREELNRRATP